MHQALTMSMITKPVEQNMLRASLSNALASEVCAPYAYCLRCHRPLGFDEIGQGFSADPLDTTIRCPREICGGPVSAILRRHLAPAAHVETEFYGPRQTIAKLTAEHASLEPTRMRAAHASLYYSAIFHFKTLDRAFARAKIPHPHPVVHDWERTVVDYLGKVPDSYIAQCAGVSVKRIRALRNARCIAPYHPRQRSD